MLANASLDEHAFSSLLSRTGELPEAEELFAACETQKSVIAQLQDQLNEEKGRYREMDTDYRSEVRVCTRMQLIAQHEISLPLSSG